MWKPDDKHFDAKLNATVPTFRHIPGFFPQIPQAMVGDLTRAPRQMLLHGQLFPTFPDPAAYVALRYKLNASALEHGACISGTDHRRSNDKEMPLRGAGQPCSHFWNIIPFVRVRHEGPCDQLAKQVGWTAGAATRGNCRVEIAMKGHDVTSIFLSMDNDECDRAESFLVVTPPPAKGPPGHAIDDEVWTT